MINAIILKVKKQIKRNDLFDDMLTHASGGDINFTCPMKALPWADFTEWLVANIIYDRAKWSPLVHGPDVYLRHHKTNKRLPLEVKSRTEISKNGTWPNTITVGNDTGLKLRTGDRFVVVYYDDAYRFGYIIRQKLSPSGVDKAREHYKKTGKKGSKCDLMPKHFDHGFRKILFVNKPAVRKHFTAGTKHNKKLKIDLLASDQEKLPYKLSTW